MKESYIRKKAKELLDIDQRLYWFCSKVRYKKESDIFGVFDGVYVDEFGKAVFLQLTTSSNVSARRAKIKKWLKKIKKTTDDEIEFNMEVWGYNKTTKKFKIIFIK
jgi:hypothetical protein